MSPGTAWAHLELGLNALAGLQGWCGAVNTARGIRKVEALHFGFDQTLLFSHRNLAEVLQSAVFSMELLFVCLSSWTWLKGLGA